MPEIPLLGTRRIDQKMLEEEEAMGIQNELFCEKHKWE